MNKRVFYVYIYVAKESGEPFYVGKGKGDRQHAHIRRARKGEESYLCEHIRKLNYHDGIKIVKGSINLSEWDALSLECKLIERIGRLDLGTGPLLNRTPG